MRLCFSMTQGEGLGGVFLLILFERQHPARHLLFVVAVAAAVVNFCLRFGCVA